MQTDEVNRRRVGNRATNIIYRAVSLVSQRIRVSRLRNMGMQVYDLTLAGGVLALAPGPVLACSGGAISLLGASCSA